MRLQAHEVQTFDRKLCTPRMACRPFCLVRSVSQYQQTTGTLCCLCFTWHSASLIEWGGLLAVTVNKSKQLASSTYARDTRVLSEMRLYHASFRSHKEENEVRCHTKCEKGYTAKQLSGQHKDASKTTSTLQLIRWWYLHSIWLILRNNYGAYLYSESSWKSVLGTCMCSLVLFVCSETGSCVCVCVCMSECMHVYLRARAFAVYVNLFIISCICLVL